MARQRRARWIRGALLALAASLLLGAGPVRAGGTEASGAVELEAPVELVWQVLTDFAGWPRFMPALARVQVERRSDALVAIQHETRQLGMDIRFTTLTRLDAASLRMESSLDPAAQHDIAGMRSAWQLTALGGGRVRVELRSDLDSGQPLPGFVVRRIVRDSVAETVEALAREVARRAEGRAEVALAAVGEARF
jgi:ribosome-associated toxin RatA of RatAB toxin-antitoxin module